VCPEETGRDEHTPSGQQMDQIIALLTNLFNLTKVASVTLPGLLTAGGLALILWPAVPIDVIPVVTNIETLESMNAPSRQSNFPPAGKAACRVEHPQVDNLIQWLERSGSKHCAVTEESGWCSDTSGDVLKKELVTGLNPFTQEALPEGQRRKVDEQFILDAESRNIAACINLEKNLQGQEEKDVNQFSADADILEKQRSAAQDSYLTYLKANDRELVSRYKWDMDELQGRIVAVRGLIRRKNFDADQRGLRLAKLTEDQRLIAERLGDPGRLRPRVGFDVFLSGLVTHVVGFILLQRS
jgi:hypothetical protein